MSFCTLQNLKIGCAQLLIFVKSIPYPLPQSLKLVITGLVPVADDHTRVRLRSRVTGGGSSNLDTLSNKEEYLNANFVDGFRQPRAYIATQGPIQGTFSGFWRMVWEQNTRVIVMITHLFENGKVHIKFVQNNIIIICPCFAFL